MLGRYKDIIAMTLQQEISKFNNTQSVKIKKSMKKFEAKIEDLEKQLHNERNAHIM
jgi:hypothetical protein